MNKKLSKESPVQDKTFLELVEELPPKRESVIPALQKIQKSRGYLPEDSLETIADYTDTPLANVTGIATFYSQFYLEPQGEHTIKVCQGTACHIKGADDILDELKRELDVTAGEVTSDGKFTLTNVRCLGACSLAPVIMVDDNVHGNLSPEKAIDVLEEYE